MERIEIVSGDITTQRVDAIVNAANEQLAGGGGVDGAIHRAAGPRLLEASRPLAPCPTGDAVLTEGFDLPARFVIHAVGPVWAGGHAGEDELLASCYRRAFTIAAENDMRSIAFPAIATDAYGFPRERAARLALLEVKRELERNTRLELIRFVLFDDEHAQIYRAMAGEVLDQNPAGH